MKSTTLASLAAGALMAALVAIAPPATAAAADADAKWNDARYCANKDDGITARKFALINRENRAVQFKVVRQNDAKAPMRTFIRVPANDRTVLRAAVKHGQESSVVVRLPDSTGDRLVMSDTLTAIESCWTPRHDPRASITRVCAGPDTLVWLDLNNQSGDFSEAYRWTASNDAEGAQGSGSVTVPAYKGTRQAWVIPAGDTADVSIRVGDKQLAVERDLAALDCN